MGAWADPLKDDKGSGRFPPLEVIFRRVLFLTSDRLIMTFWVCVFPRCVEFDSFICVAFPGERRFYFLGERFGSIGFRFSAKGTHLVEFRACRATVSPVRSQSSVRCGLSGLSRLIWTGPPVRRLPRAARYMPTVTSVA